MSYNLGQNKMEEQTLIPPPPRQMREVGGVEISHPILSKIVARTNIEDNLEE